VNNVTPPSAAGPRPVTTPTPRARQNQLILLAVFFIVLVLLVRACAGAENKYEKIAHQLTQAIQNGDVAAVQKLENVGTAADMPRERLGHATDQLAPLGKIKRVKENTPASDGPRIHEFDVTFEKGTVHENIELDPQDKIFHFHYTLPQKAT
jgi:hypothetical protein